MKTFLVLILLIISAVSFAQKDIDVVYLKSGVRYSCEIKEIRNDSIFFTQFSGRHLKEHALALDETAVYIVNNFYSTPGEELNKVARKLIFGTSFFAVGGTLAALGYADDRDNLFAIGAGVAALGTIFYISGFDNLRKVGQKIDKVSFQGDRLIFKL